MPLRLSDQPRDPEAEATLLESDGAGMAGMHARVCVCVYRRQEVVSHLLWAHETKLSCVGRRAAEHKEGGTWMLLVGEIHSAKFMRRPLCWQVPWVLRKAPWCALKPGESKNFVSRKLRALHAHGHQTTHLM